MDIQPDIHFEAQRRVRNRAKFYKHLIVYLIVNGFMFVTLLLDGHPFGMFPMTVFWGMGLFFHYLKVFGLPGNGVLSNGWESREYQRELEKLRKEKGQSKTMDEHLELKEMSKNYRDSDLV